MDLKNEHVRYSVYGQVSTIQIVRLVMIRLPRRKKDGNVKIPIKNEKIINLNQKISCGFIALVG